MELLHIGVPTKEVQENEMYNGDLQVHITDPEASKFKFEYLRFDEDAKMAKEVQEQVHVAIKVDSIDEYFKLADKILLDKYVVNENMTIAFIEKDKAILELVEMK